MQTTYRLKAQEISMTFLKSLKKLFAGQEIEIIVKSVEPGNSVSENHNKGLLQMIRDNRHNAPVISANIDLRELIDSAHNPAAN